MAVAIRDGAVMAYCAGGASPAPLPNLDLLDAAGLKALILSQHNELVATQQRLVSREAEIEHLKLLIAKLRRMQLGRKSEKPERQIEQLELRLNELEAARAERTLASATPAVSEPAAKTETKPARPPLPAHLPRETRKILPKQEACPDCGGAL